MPLSWNEIKSRSIAFSKQWEDESSEDAEAKSFWDGFFNIFGISRRRVASFEAPVKKLGDRLGFIDLFWKGMLLVEHKSRGKRLDRAYEQALNYFPGINERDLPQYVLVSDFERFHLHCVIIGFAVVDIIPKLLFEYENIKGEPHMVQAGNINPYLVDALDTVLINLRTPICSVPQIGIGNKPIDGGNYLFTEEEKTEYLKKEPQATPYFRRWLGADEFLNNWHRYCLWLGDCSPSELKNMPEAMKRIESVKTFRLVSKSAPTQKLAETPTRFHVENMPDGKFMVMPEVSSERRVYIPFGFLNSDTFASNKLRIMANANLYQFEILTSVLLKAHKELDKAVDAAYGQKNFKTEAERVAFLFELYQKYTS